MHFALDFTGFFAKFAKFVENVEIAPFAVEFVKVSGVWFDNTLGE